MGMPILVGALADLRGYSEEAVGYIASAELGGMFLASVFVSVFVYRLNRRLGALAGLLLSLLINILSTQVEAYGPFMAMRVVAGFGAGLCYSIAIANLSATENRATQFYLSDFCSGGGKRHRTLHISAIGCGMGRECYLSRLCCIQCFKPCAHSLHPGARS